MRLRTRLERLEQAVVDRRDSDDEIPAFNWFSLVRAVCAGEPSPPMQPPKPGSWFARLGDECMEDADESGNTRGET
jgi:hypothetical protein